MLCPNVFSYAGRRKQVKSVSFSNIVVADKRTCTYAVQGTARYEWERWDSGERELENAAVGIRRVVIREKGIIEI